MEKLLRTLALLGPVIVLAVDLILDGSWKPGQGYAAAVTVGILLAAGIGLILVLPREARDLARQPDLLVPLGLYVLATAVLGWCLALPLLGAVLQPTWELAVLSMSFSLSLAMLATIALAVAFTAWALALVILVTTHQPAGLLRGLEQMKRGYWRTLGYMSIAMTAFFLLLAVALALASLSIYLAMAFILAETVLLNFATAGVLLRGMARPETPFWPCLREGLAVSLRNARRWWIPLLLQMELLGLCTYIHLTWSTPGNFRTVSNWSVNGMWTGGFERETRWLSQVMDAVEQPAPMVTVTILGLALGVFAIALKLRIARELHGLGELSETAPQHEAPGRSAPVAPPAATGDVDGAGGRA